jgi:hypothetical protein
MLRMFLIFLILFFTSACNEEQLSESEINSSYKLWLSKNIHNYSVDQKRSCFCPDAGELVRITVRSDSIFNIVKVSDNSKITSPYYFTIDSLFGIINDSENDSLVIKYNRIYGYPEYLDINPQLHPVDGGVLYETSNLQVQ